MFSHSFLYELAEATCMIQQKNTDEERIGMQKGDTNQDVVSASDLSNEQSLFVLLKNEIPDLNYIYGEEYGYNYIGPGRYGVLIDPIDGTRPYTAGFFYSGISVAITDMNGFTIAGYIVSINNQNLNDLDIWTFDGCNAEKNGASFTVDRQITSIKEACVSVTNVSLFSEKERILSAILFKLIADRTRGPASLCSGAMETISVIEGKLGGYVNVYGNDFVSHPVAVEIAKSLGFYVRHIFSDGDSFAISVDNDSRTIKPAYDLSLVVAPFSLKNDIDNIIDDALNICSRKHTKNLMKLKQSASCEKNSN